MNNGYEYYYLFGLDIPLEKYGLGKIKQPKIKDFLSKDIGIDSFFYPFVMNDIVIGQTKEKDSVLKLKESMGDLTFLLVNCLQSNRNDMLFAIKQSLEFLYDEEVEITDKFTIQIGEVEINNSTLGDIYNGSSTIDIKDSTINSIDFNSCTLNMDNVIIQSMPLFKNLNSTVTMKNMDMVNTKIENSKNMTIEENVTAMNITNYAGGEFKYNNSKIIYENNKHLFLDKKQEYFYCLYLNEKKELIERKLLFMGTVNKSLVHPREIFKEAYLLSASSIICMHNHPSGNPNPSTDDIVLTSSLLEIGKIQKIPIVDHIIFGSNSYYSFYENNNLERKIYEKV